MSNSSISRDRTVVFVLNILIFILSLCVTLNYFGVLGAYRDENNKWKNDTFFGFEMRLTLSEDDIVELIPLEEHPNITQDEVKASIQLQDGKLSIPPQIEEQYGEENLYFSIPTSMLWDINGQMLKQLIKQFNFNIDTTGYTETLLQENIDKNVDIIVETLMPVIEDVALLIAKDVAVEEARTTLINAILAKNEGADIAMIETELDLYGYGGNYVENQLNDLMSHFEEDGKATVNELTTDIVAMLEATITDFSTNETIPADSLLKNATTDSIDTTALTASITSGLSQFADKDGVLDVKEAIASLLLQGLQSSDKSEEPAPAEVNTEEEKSAVEELKEEIKANVLAVIPESLTASVGETAKIFAGILLLSTVSWIYLMLKIICKLFARNNAVKLRATIILGALPGLLWSTPKFLSFLASLIPVETLAKIIPMETITLFTETLSLSVFTCGWLAFIAVIALILFSIPYSASRKRLERRKLS